MLDLKLKTVNALYMQPTFLVENTKYAKYFLVDIKIIKTDITVQSIFTRNNKYGRL